MPLPPAVVANRCRLLARRCRPPPVAAGSSLPPGAGRRTSGSPGCKDNGFFGAHQLFASKSFSGPEGHHRGGTAAEWTAARKPHRNAALTLPRRHCRPKALPPNGPPPGSPENRCAPVAEALSPGGVPCPEARRTAALPPRRHCRPEARRRRDRPLSGFAARRNIALLPPVVAARRRRPLCRRLSQLPARRSCPLCRRPSKQPAPRRKSSKRPAIAPARRTGG